MRDMTQREFDAACQRYGFKAKGFAGYYALPCGVETSILNAGPTRRARLAHLIETERRYAKKLNRV
jgi:hypothetical protein